MLYIHRNSRGLGLGASYSHSDTIPVVVGAAVGRASLGLPGGTWGSIGPWRLDVMLRFGITNRVGLTSPLLGSNVTPYSGWQVYQQ